MTTLFSGRGGTPRSRRLSRGESTPATPGCRLRWVQVLLLVLSLTAPAALLARGGGGCLEQGTPVLTPSGQTPVEQLRPGDAVLAVSHGVTVTARVQAVTQVQPAEYCEFVVEGQTLRVTATHPVESEPGVFRVAGVLRAGDSVCVRRDGAIRPATVDSIIRVRPAAPAFNLLVAPGGTYIAGHIVVHNKGCFLPATPILKADGAEAPISTIVAGDRVLAFTPDGQTASATVQRVLTCDVDEYRVVRTATRVLRVTPEHPFYVGRGTFKTLEILQAGDEIFAFDGRALAAQRIESIETVRAATRVYNLQTDAPNTFFADGIAVHNKGGGGSHGSSHSSHSSAHFSHSSTSGSHGGSGGSAGASASSRAVLVFFGVVFGVICLAVLASRKKGRDKNLDFMYTPAQVAKKSDKTLKLLEFIARQDPALAPAALREHATSTFLKLQQCWQAREYGPMQPLMMPDLYAEHLGQIQGLIRSH